MAQTETEVVEQYAAALVDTKNVTAMTGHIMVSLARIAIAQERMVELAEMDLQATVEEEIKSRAETLALEIDAEKSKRSFIGRK